jgi:ERF superfamily
MHPCSETIGAIATALAKAQAELVNPEKTLTATIVARNGERTFRYASLATGLDLIRKCLGQHEIAIVQSTALDQGRIMLTTRLVHASGEWVSSLWPVCLAAEASAHVKGAALTYARRYALFTLVGIAGEDDLDAPELVQPPEPPLTEQPVARKPGNGNGSAHSPRQPPLAPDQSAPLRDQLVQEISALDTADALALWAHRSLPLKNTLTQQDAQAVEAAYLAKLGGCSEEPNVSEAPSPVAELTSSAQSEQDLSPTITALVTPLTKPVRRPSKAHLAFVASQPCVICKVSPCDAHHLKIAQPRSLGRKVSDEFTVPLCRKHHQELHRHGNEANWWVNMQVTPLPIAKELWEISPVHGVSRLPLEHLPSA